MHGTPFQDRRWLAPPRICDLKHPRELLALELIQLHAQRHLRGPAARPVLSLPLTESPVVCEPRGARTARKIAALFIVWIDGHWGAAQIRYFRGAEGFDSQAAFRCKRLQHGGATCTTHPCATSALVVLYVLRNRAKSGAVLSGWFYSMG
jgi:hypothetical protein